MKKRGYTLIELLSVVVILAVICAIAIPKTIDVIGATRITAYNTAKGNILDSAKLKYLADINTSKVVEYTVDDLISSGYLKKGIKNPITNENYKDTKVIITNDDNKVTYNYVEGNTLYDIVSNLNDKDGVYKNKDEYIYKGMNANNYISYDGNVYRILKIDSYRNVYLLKNTEKDNVTSDFLEEYINSYYNDNYLEISKENIISLDTLNYNDYLNSFIDNDTYIINNNNIYVKDNESYKVLSSDTNSIMNRNNANVRFVLKIKSSVTIKNGNGTQLKPYEM